MFLLLGSRPNMAASSLRFLDHTQLDTHTQTAGLLWMSEQLVAESSTYTKHKKKTHIHGLSEIRTHDLSIPAAADRHL